MESKQIIDMRMKRSKIAITGLLVGMAIYGGGAVLALVRAAESGWTTISITQMVWPLLVASAFGISALVVYRKSAPK